MSKLQPKHTCIALMVMLPLFASPTWLPAQVVGGTISGTVVDASGAVTPGVTISIKSAATGVATNTVTNGVGFYSVPTLRQETTI